MLPTMTANVPKTSSSPKNQSPRDQASLTFRADEIEANEAEQGERTHERWAGVGAPLLVQWPLERKALVGARPVMWSRRQDDQLCQGAPPLRQVGQSAEDGQQRIDLDALTCRVELAVVEGAQWEMVTGAQLERDRGDLLVGPDLGGIACGKVADMEGPQNCLRIGRAELAGDAPQFMERWSRGQENGAGWRRRRSPATLALARSVLWVPACRRGARLSSASRHWCAA